MSAQPPPVARPTLPPEALLRRLGATLESTIAELSHAGERQRATQLDRERRRPRTIRPVVIVTGESKTGKSSLVNALVGRPGLSPVDFDIATGACVYFVHSERDTARVHLLGDQKPVSIAIDEVAQWASAEHNPNNVKRVRSVEVGVDAPLLRSVTLVDTPGSGGLDTGHAALTLAALLVADALIFTSEASGPLTAPELRFLEGAAERIDAVLLVLTQADLNADWQIIDRDNAALLRTKAPRFADSPCVAVSALLADRARELEDEADSSNLLKESGVPALERALSRLVGARPNANRYANAVRFADSSLRVLESSLTARLSAASGDPALKAKLEQERERLKQLQREKGTWNRDLDIRLRKINLDRADAVTRGITEVRTHYDAISSEKREQELAELPGQLLEDVSALAGRIATETTESIREAVAEILGELDASSEVHELLSEVEGVTVKSDMHLGAPIERSTTQFDRLTTLQSWSSGRSIGGYAVSLPMFAMGGVPLLIAGCALASVFAWKAHGGRKLLTRQADFRGWQREQLLLVQTELNNEFSRKMIDLQPAISDAIRDYLAEREKEVTEQIAAWEEAQKRGTQESAQLRKQLNERLLRVRKLLEQTTDLLDILRVATG